MVTNASLRCTPSARRTAPTPAVLALVATVACWQSPDALQASVVRHPWQQGSFQAAVDQAAREKRAVVLVVTQPDWCPPCIVIDSKWLSNPAETEVRDLTAEAIVLEVLGYDDAGAAVLRAQSVRFQGTPTVHVFHPARPGQVLGRAPLAGSIVGAPADFPGRLRLLLEGQDGLPELEAAVAAAQGAARSAALLKLAEAHLARGAADEAASALRSVHEVPKTGLPGDDAQSLRADQSRAEWLRAQLVDGRVRKDHGAALRGIDAWIAKHGRPEGERADIAYARAWALAHLGRTAEARAEMEAAYLGEGTDRDLATFAYFCFRVASPDLLSAAAGKLREALAAPPGSDSAELWQAYGRIQRRQGLLDLARTSFARAVALAASEDDRLVNAGQLAHVEAELAERAQPAPASGPRSASR